MCIAYTLRQHGIVMTQQEVRNRTKLWLAGAVCFGKTLHHWAAVSRLTPDSFIDQLRTTGWGTAVDACILANSLQVSCYIYDAEGTLLVSSPCSRSLFNMNFRLAGEHYTVVDDTNIEKAQRYVSSCYWYKTKVSSSWRLLTNLQSLLKRNGVIVPAAACNPIPSPFSSSSSPCSSHGSQSMAVKTPGILNSSLRHLLPWYSGGPLRAQTNTSAKRQFQLVGQGEDGHSIHIVMYVHDLAVQAANAPGQEEDQPSFEGSSCTLLFEDDDRPLVLTHLRHILDDFLSFANYYTSPQVIADRAARQSREPSPRPACCYYHIGSEDEGSEISDEYEYSHIGSIGCECRTSDEYESDYAPSSMDWSRCAEWNGSHLTQSVLSAFSTAFDVDDHDTTMGDVPPVGQRHHMSGHMFACYRRIPACAYCRAFEHLEEGPCGGTLPVLQWSMSSCHSSLWWIL
eukprot:552217-Amphidinium_carterae.2